jgi:hypothetical protein
LSDDGARRAANAGHRVLAPDDAEVEAYLDQALHALVASLDTYDLELGTPALARTFGVRLTSVDERALQVAAQVAG